jgi:hypothetical protein
MLFKFSTVLNKTPFLKSSLREDLGAFIPLLRRGWGRLTSKTSH